MIEIDYAIDPDNARAYYLAMLEIQRTRLRNGGFDWSISRDMADPTLWIERYHFPTWADYLRMRDRFTQADFDAQEAVDEFLIPGRQKHIRRRLERPFGSVRFKVDTPDPHQETLVYMGP
nr:MFS transporter [Oceanicoccus sp. KOV_DT_Chl]